ncbi:hypothetical protein [Ochrobactrum sp. A-1]|nr:hypothetical protein [Ochrobactrum sp. A-1]
MTKTFVLQCTIASEWKVKGLDAYTEKKAIAKARTRFATGVGLTAPTSPF